MRALGYQSFRAPTLNELYRPFQVGTILTSANENLRAERLVGGELGVEGLFGQASAVRVTGFWNVLINPIANVTLAMALPDGSMRQRQNLGRVTIRGVECSADLRLGRHVWAQLAYTAADTRVSEAPGHADLIGKKLPQDPVHRGRAALSVSYGRFEATLQARAQTRLFEDDLNTLPMDGFAVMDAFARVALGWHTEIYATAENLLDHRYTVGRARYRHHRTAVDRHRRRARALKTAQESPRSLDRRGGGDRRSGGRGRLATQGRQRAVDVQVRRLRGAVRGAHDQRFGGLTDGGEVLLVDVGQDLAGGGLGASPRTGTWNSVRCFYPKVPPYSNP